MAGKATITVKIFYDPILTAMMEEAQRCPEFQEIAKSLAEKDNVCVAEFRNGAVIAHPSDEMLEAYYNHKAGL